MKLQPSYGFTLIELLVVISIIGMLASVVLVALQGAKDKATIGAAIEFADTNYHAVGAYGMVQLNFDNNTNDQSGSNDSVFTSSGLTYQTDTPSGTGASISMGAASQLVMNISPTLTPGSPSGLEDYTASVWIKPKTNFSSNQIVFYSDGCYGGSYPLLPRCMNLQFIHNGAACAYPGVDIAMIGPNDGGWNSDLVLPVSQLGLTLNKWQNITYTYKPGTTPSYVVYVNGKQVYNGPNNCSNTPYNGTVTKVVVGNGIGGNTNFLGYIDDLAIYKQALSDADVEQIYAMGAAKHGLAFK